MLYITVIPNVKVTELAEATIFMQLFVQERSATHILHCEVSDLL